MGRYRRTVSFPNPPNFRPAAAKQSYHVRSASLPCNRAHPILPQLRDQLDDLRSWAQPTSSGPDSGRAREGLARLKSVLDSFDDVLQLPAAQDALSPRAALVEGLLEDFLRFVDAFGIFRAAALGLKQELSGAQVAVRRRDASKLGLHVKAQRKIAAEIGRLVSAVGSLPDHPAPCTLAAPNPSTSNDEEYSEEILLAIRDVHRLTSSVSAGLFAAVSGSFGPGRRSAWIWRPARKEGGEGVIGEAESLMAGLSKKNKTTSSSNSTEQEEELEKKRKNEEVRIMEVLRRMQEMEDCVGEIERESERVFRSLISTRVSLLNILTHA